MAGAPALELEVEGRRLTVTNPDKVLWPRTGFTKGDMIGYYRRVGPVLVPHIARRPLTLGRFPAGVDGRGFAMTECRGRPGWVATRPLRLASGETRAFCVANDVPSLLWMANLSAIELHPYLGAGDRGDEAVVAVFDLDPGPQAALSAACALALVLRELLSTAGLAACAKTSGASGLHVFVPLNDPHPYAVVRGFAEAIAVELAARQPDRTTHRIRADRRGKVLVDWQVNHPRRSIVAAYSLRATSRPLVSTPVGWEEVEQAAAGSPLAFGPEAVVDRVERLGDLFAPVLETRQRLPI